MPGLGTLAGARLQCVVIGRIVPKANDRLDPRRDFLRRRQVAGFRV